MKQTRPKKEDCPFCGRLYTVGTGLAAHIRLKHKNAPQGQPVASNRVIKTGPAVTVAPMMDSQTRVQEALDQLIARKSEVDQELGRKDALREEGVQLTRRIEALTIAMRAWDQNSMAASG